MLTPLISTPKLAESRDFFTRHFGFTVTFDSPGYVGLKRGASEIAFMRPVQHESGKTFDQIFVIDF